MLFKKNSISLVTFIVLAGSAAFLFYSRKDGSDAKTVLIAKDAVPEIPCYDSTRFKPPSEIKKFTYQGKTYFETKSPERTSPSTFILNFETTPTSCRQIVDQSISSREDRMPKPVAEYFGDQYIEGVFQTCLRKKYKELNSREKCRAYLERVVNVPGNLTGEYQSYLLIEDAEALNRRGIKTNKALIIKPKTGYNSTQIDKKDLPTGEALKAALKKCVKVTSPESVKNISVVQIEVANVPTRGKRTYYDIDVELVNGKTSRHVYQTIYLSSESCRNFYAGSDIGVNSLSANAYLQEDARSQLLIWYKWKLKNVPDEQARIQRYLSSPNPKLAEEEYWTFSQLGFKMPKVYKKVP